MRSISVLVEGDGDITAVPVLIRQCLEDLNVYDVKIARPIKFGGFPKGNIPNRFSRLFSYAQRQPDTIGTVIVADCDDSCPLEVKDAVAGYVASEGLYAAQPFVSVLLSREFEGLFLADLQNLRNRGLVSCPDDDAQRLAERCERIRDAKGEFQRWYERVAYKETRDQTRVVAQLDIASVERVHRGARRLRTALVRLLDGEGDLIA